MIRLCVPQTIFNVWSDDKFPLFNNLFENRKTICSFIPYGCVAVTCQLAFAAFSSSFMVKVGIGNYDTK